MKRLIFALSFIALAPICPAQEANQPESKQEAMAGFDWLKQFEGTWATEFDGTMQSRNVGNRWIVSEISFPKNGVYSIQTIGQLIRMLAPNPIPIVGAAVRRGAF